MKVIYSVVSNPHPHTLTGRLARTYTGHFYWDRTEANETTHAVLATHKQNGKLIGIQKFDFKVQGRRRLLTANATFVWPLYRGINIAQCLWTKAIDELDVTKVIVGVVSDRGKTLVETLSDQHDHILFEMRDDGARPLRSLKGSKGAKARRAA